MSLFTRPFPQKFKTFFKKFRKFNSLNKLDLKMLEYINYYNGFFIECGASDGVDQSNTWYYEKSLNWNGILIEPLYEKYLELKKNRSNKNLFFNNILSDSINHEFLNIKNNNLISQVVSQNNNEKNVLKVRATTLTKLLDDVSAPRLIDFFSLDVEGFEEKVIKGINFSKYNFKYFLIETTNKKVFEILKEANYLFIKKMSHCDYLFIYRGK